MQRISRARHTVVVMLALIAFTGNLAAQRWNDTNPPVRTSYGYRPHEFPIIASPTKWAGDTANPFGSPRNLWNFAHDMGFSVYHVIIAPSERRIVDGMVDADTLRRHGSNNEPELDTDRIILSDAKSTVNAWQAGFGRELQFYPFDSVQSPYFIWKFDHRSGGVRDTNSVRDERIRELPNEEQVYTLADTSPGDTVAGGLSYYNVEDPPQPWHLFDAYTEIRDSTTGGGRTYTFAITGHLFDSLNSANGPGTPVFGVVIRHLIDSGTVYLNDSLQQVLALADFSVLVDTFSVTQGQLREDTTKTRVEYRDVSHSIDLRLRPIDGGPGPMHPNLPVWLDTRTWGNRRRIDVQIIWTGAEKAALRSLAIRDSLAQLMLGSEASARAYRDSLVDALAIVLRGPANRFNRDSLRHCIIAVENGTEPFWSEFAGFDAVRRILSDSFNLRAYRMAHGDTLHPGDSIDSFIWGSNGTNFNYLTSARTLHTEFAYLAQRRDTVARFGGNNQMQVFTETPNHQIPSLIEHNGGRFHLPLLDTTRSSIEDYETTLQRGFVGYFQPGENPGDYFHRPIPGAVDQLAESAQSARRTGVRLMPHVGTIMGFVIRDDSIGVDTLASHTPEAAELRMFSNLVLAYGGTGLWWWNLQTNPYIMRLSPFGRWITKGGSNAEDNCCWGASGFLNSDTIPHSVDSLDSVDRAHFRLFDAGRTERAVIPAFYLGWRARTRGIKWINKVLLGPNGIGPEMTNWRWRDAYSVHHAVRWPGLVHDTLYRPIPADEIVTAVQSWDPRTGVLDSAHRTFVELGLFYTRRVASPGSSDTSELNDVNACYVVNRRTFERPAEISDTSVRGKAMDNLAETRCIRLQFHLRHPAEDTLRWRQYAFIRVRELHPDVTPLPCASGPRKPLDTLIYGDSSVVLTLGPGRGAMLEITFAPPDTSLAFGDLRFNGQRKMAFTGRYHLATYWRHGYDSASARWNDTVFYRRSLPVDSTSGSVLWEPVEWPISAALAGGDTARIHNMFPSITYRTSQTPPSPPDTVAYVVWTCHPSDTVSSPNRRQIALRAFRVNGPIPDWGRIETAGVLSPDNPAQYGTPAISALRGREALAWSDSLRGIVIRMRHDTTGSQWWKGPGWYTPYDSISTIFTGSPWPGQYPSLPTFSHPIADTTITVVWQQSYPPSFTRTLYARLHDQGRFSAPWIGMANWLDGSNSMFHPSIDLAQDSGADIREGVVWEEYDPWYDRICYRSMSTWYTVNQNGVTIGVYGAGPLTKLASHIVSPVDSAWPNVASLNLRAGFSSRTDSTRFAVTAMSTAWMLNERIPFDSVTQALEDRYSFGGRWPSLAASRVRQDTREASLYCAPNPTTGMYDLLRTSRQFFVAKARPLGYVAEGREVSFRLSDTGAASGSVLLLDAWLSDASGSTPLRMSRLVSVPPELDSMSEAGPLMRTEAFRTYDSVTIGIELHARLRTDDSSANAVLDAIVEVVDSASGIIVLTLDSLRLSGPEQVADTIVACDADLISSSYYVRVRLGCSALDPVASPGGGRLIVANAFRRIDDAGTIGRRSRSAASGRLSLRLTAEPNPCRTAASVRFSVPRADYVEAALLDATGTRLGTILPRSWREAGRYLEIVDASHLTPGTYIVAFRSSTRSESVRFVVIR